MRRCLGGKYASTASTAELTRCRDKSPMARYLCRWSPFCSAMQKSGDIARFDKSDRDIGSGLDKHPLMYSPQDNSERFDRIVCPRVLVIDLGVARFLARTPLRSAIQRAAEAVPPPACTLDGGIAPVILNPFARPIGQYVSPYLRPFARNAIRGIFKFLEGDSSSMTESRSCCNG